MAKKKVSCPVCKKAVDNHKITAALECVNELGLQDAVITLDDAYAAGLAFGDLKGWGQKHGDKNIITLNIKGKQVESIEPELFIFRNILSKRATKEKKDGDQASTKKSDENDGSTKAPTS